ncbi:MAG: S41 family peptidase [Oscillospiraceae bacterium]|nr:S41 family peptidase [Oscillospiraceae bacterium]
MKPFLKNILIVVVTAAISISGTALAYNIYNENKPFSADSYGSIAADKIKKINSYIKSEYLYDDYNQRAMDEAAAKAYVEALNEPYTHYYSKEEFEAYRSGVEDSYVGIGIVISVDETEGKIIVVSPTEDSPAYHAGLLPGDYILAVDGTKYGGAQMDECVSAIKGGPAGTKVVISIERGGMQKDYTIERQNISSDSVKGEMIGSDIGYVRISAFNTNEAGSKETTYTEFKSEIDKLKDEGMEKLIIDLRDNPGGVLDVVCDIADYLLPKGIITYTETRSGRREEYKSDSNELDIPIVVLINGGSASASEILTGALKDYGRAKVVGETSFGKGIVQTVIPFSDGSGMSITIAKYYTPNGICIHGEGIKPDYEISLPNEYKDGYASSVPRDKDTQLQKALELLNE